MHKLFISSTRSWKNWISRLLLSMLIVSLFGLEYVPLTVLGQDPDDDCVLYLPMVANWYDPDYLPAWGIRMSSDIDDSLGLAKMQEAGSRWLTTNFLWSDVEPTQNNYQWSRFDTKVRNAHNAGMTIFVMFTHNPTWAAQYPGGPVYSSKEQSLINIVTRAAERYDGDGYNDAPGSPIVHYWSFYAEPDNGDPKRAAGGKGYWGNNGPGYAAMLAKITPAIHSANPQAKILIGGLAYDWFTEYGGPYVRSFLPNTLGALNTYPGGASAYIDAVAFHYYPINLVEWPTIKHKAEAIKSVMYSYGIGHLPLVSPEMAMWSAEEVSFFPSSESIQANRLVQMFARGLSMGMNHMSWYRVFDSSVGTADEAGLFWNQSLSQPKQSYYAYRIMAQELEYATYLYPFSAPNIEGYVFQLPFWNEETVLWATSSSAQASFSGTCIKKTSITGFSQTIYDGQAGDLDGTNGQVRITVYQDTPVYVEDCP